MRMYKYAGVIVVLLLATSGCSQSTSENAGISSRPVIEGEVNQASYDHAVEEILAHAIVVMNSKKPIEQEIDDGIGKIEALLALAKEKKELDAKSAHEAALMSTLGTLYARKAEINNSNPRSAGALIADSYRYLDKAISRHPQDLMARVNRGLVSSKVPDFLGKAEIAHEDLKFVRDHADFGKLSPKLQDTIKQALAEVDSRLAKSDLER